MTAPLWMAFPPEIHSALLSSGPGSGPLLAAAAQWHLLSTEYLAAADGVEQALAITHAWSWQGASADRYVARHRPFLGWLAMQSDVSAANAAHLETVAAAYTAALGAMPTVPEIAAHRAAHAALVATNFFGINTIPIAVNEADYMRMWIQAATTMEIYQAVSEAAVLSVAPPVPAPLILAPGAESFGAAADLLHRTAGSRAAESGSALAGSESIADQLEGFVRDPLGTLRRILADFALNPIGAAITWAPLLLILFGVYLTAHGTAASISWGLLIGSMGIWLPFVVGSALQTPVADGEAPADVDEPIRPGSAQVPRPEPHPTVAAAPSGAAGTATTASAAPSSTSAPAPTTATSPTFPYLVPPAKDQPPATAFGPTLGEGTTNRAPATGASAVSAASDPAHTGARRRRRARDKDPARQHMDADMEIDTGTDTGRDAHRGFQQRAAHSAPQSTPSGQGAGRIGSTATVPMTTSGANARGLAAGPSDPDAGGEMPVLPASWDATDEPRRMNPDLRAH